MCVYAKSYANEKQFGQDEFLQMTAKSVKALNTLARQESYEQLLEFMQRIRSQCPMFDTFHQLEQEIDTFCIMDHVEDMTLGEGGQQSRPRKKRR